MSQKKLLANYHTHTQYCNHAENTIEENVELAIKYGLKVLGFSEHCFSPSATNNHYRLGSADIVEEYLKTIDICKEKYRDKIQILAGFEVDYFLKDLEWLKNLYHREDVDFFVLGLHGTKVGAEFKFTDMDQQHLKKYCSLMVDAMKSDLFDYVAHPDLFTESASSWNKTHTEISYQIARLAKQLNIPLGFNINGMFSKKRKYLDGWRYIYPHQKFWEIVAEVQAPVLIEMDVHNEAMWTSEVVAQAIAWTKELNLKVIDYLTLKKENYNA